MTTELSLKTERTIPAPPEKVFNAWLDPEMLKRFMIPGAGMSVPRASAEPREGGAFEIVMKAGDQEMPHTGRYKEIRPHERLVFTWQSAASTEPDSTVTLTFAPAGGGTRVTLEHVRFPSGESRDNHAAGWGAILDALGAALTREGVQ